MEETGEWLELVVDNDYEIFNQYPYPIRRKGSDKVISEWITDKGYVRCKLNGKPIDKHRIIALQFIENDDPESKPFIDQKANVSSSITASSLTNPKFHLFLLSDK